MQDRRVEEVGESHDTTARRTSGTKFEREGWAKLATVTG